MAKPNWKAIGAGFTLVGILLTVVGIAWATGSKTTAMEKDIEANGKSATDAVKVVSDNQAEDRVAIKDIAVLVTALKEEHDEDVERLVQGDNDAKLRDAKTASDYTAILGHMQQQTAHDEREAAARIQEAKGREQMQIKLTEVQVKVETLIKGE